MLENSIVFHILVGTGSDNQNNFFLILGKSRFPPKKFYNIDNWSKIYVKQSNLETLMTNICTNDSSRNNIRSSVIGLRDILGRYLSLTTLFSITYMMLYFEKSIPVNWLHFDPFNVESNVVIKIAKDWIRTTDLSFSGFNSTNCAIVTVLD